MPRLRPVVGYQDDAIGQLQDNYHVKRKEIENFVEIIIVYFKKKSYLCTRFRNSYEQHPFLHPHWQWWDAIRSNELWRETHALVGARCYGHCEMTNGTAKRSINLFDNLTS